MATEQQHELRKVLTPRLTKYIPHKPTAKQTAFLLLDCEEAFYGGAAGGGKSDALLMAALQYVDVPGYNAVLFRKTFQDLDLPDALMTRSREWLAPFRLTGEVHWNERTHTWTFPSGATLSFGYMEHENDRFRYQGAAYHFIGFDELTQIAEICYTYLFSRNRRLAVQGNIPLRVRAASNPGGDGHEWVKQRFLTEGLLNGRIFIPALLGDNPHLDKEEYRKKLMKLDAVTRAQLLEGNWEVRHGGSIFDRKWFEKVDILPDYLKNYRYWDLAATNPEKNKKAKYTCGLLLGEYKGRFWVCDVVRMQDRPYLVESKVTGVALLDGRRTVIGMEQEPGSSGIGTVEHYQNLLKGYVFKPDRVTGSKEDRALPVSSAAEQGLFYMLRAYWNSAFLDEVELFPNGTYKDQVDSLSGAFNMAVRNVGMRTLPIPVGVGENYWHVVNYN